MAEGGGRVSLKKAVNKFDKIVPIDPAGTGAERTKPSVSQPYVGADVYTQGQFVKGEKDDIRFKIQQDLLKLGASPAPGGNPALKGIATPLGLKVQDQRDIDYLLRL